MLWSYTTVFGGWPTGRLVGITIICTDQGSSHWPFWGVLSDRSRRVKCSIWKGDGKGHKRKKLGFFFIPAPMGLEYVPTIWIIFLYFWKTRCLGKWNVRPISICQINSNYCQGTVQTPSFSVGAPKGKKRCAIGDMSQTKRYLSEGNPETNWKKWLMSVIWFIWLCQVGSLFFRPIVLSDSFKHYFADGKTYLVPTNN